MIGSGFGQLQDGLYRPSYDRHNPWQEPDGQQGGYGASPHPMFTGGNQHPSQFPQRPPNFNPMPMGGMGQPFGGSFSPQSFGKPPDMPSMPFHPPQTGGYDSSGINPGGMYSQQGGIFSQNKASVGGSMRPLFPQFGGMYQGGYGQG